jgi:hypothetical protein
LLLNPDKARVVSDAIANIDQVKILGQLRKMPDDDASATRR